MNKVFDQSVRLLQLVSEQLGMTYQELNVYIFLILEPIVFAILLIKIYLLTNKLNNYERS
jgi:hypothetical protein